MFFVLFFHLCSLTSTTNTGTACSNAIKINSEQDKIKPMYCRTCSADRGEKKKKKKRSKLHADEKLWT